MLEFLKKIFGGSEGRQARGGSATAIATEDLERLEAEIARAPRGRAARLLNRAGDLYLAQDDRGNALRSYGDAIDSYMQTGEYDSAMAVCRKIIRVVPEVIRTRRTLAWLCLGKGFLEIAREHIEAYTNASLQSDLHSLATQQLLLMAQYVDKPDFREFLAGQLEKLGDDKAASRVREGKAAEGVQTAGWAPVVFGALLKPDEMRQAMEKGVELTAPTGDMDVDSFESLLLDLDLGPQKGKKSGEGEAPDE